MEFYDKFVDRFQDISKVKNPADLVDLVVLNFDFDLIPTFYFLKWNRYFSASERKFAKFFMSFLKAQASFPSNFASIFSAVKHDSSVLSLAQKLCSLVKSSPLTCKFWEFFVLGSKFVKFFTSILNQQVNSSPNFALFFIVMTHNSSVNFKLIHCLLWIKSPNKSHDF